MIATFLESGCMMEFFRKYQRFFLIAITAVVIASFLFFGAFSTYTDQSAEMEDRLVTHAIDGSKLMRSQVQKLSRFLATDQQDISYRHGPLPNFCNDGVIRQDLLQTGLAEVLVSGYFDSMREGLQDLLEKVKHYHPYVHPEAPFLSAVVVWDRFVPGLHQAISTLQQEVEITPQVFTQLTHLYQFQTRCPPEWLRRILLFQQQQYSWVKPDPRLQQEDFSLFGCHTLSDWFGPHFLDLCAEFIVNAARAAEQKGYRVSLEEAKADLINHFSFAAHKVPELNFQSHLQLLGFDEKSASEVWRDVLLFRRYFQGVGQAVFVDRLPYCDFASYALESAIVQLYEWPQALRFKQFSDLIQFQFYCQAVAREENPLALPSELKALEEIEEQTPELVQASYSAKVAKVSQEEVGLRASVKEVWEWELGEKNWEALCKQFPSLPAAVSPEERFKALESLPIVQRNGIDAFARKALVEAHPEWIEAACPAPTFQEIHLSKTLCSLPYISQPEAFAASLETASVTEMPFRYCDDGVHHYQLLDVKKTKEKHLLTFESAKAKGILAKLVERKLEKEYIAQPSRWGKTFLEVKDLVAADLYRPLLDAIDQADPREWKTGEGPLASYPPRRLLSSTQTAWSALQQEPLDGRWIQSGGDPLIEQFKLEKKEQQIQRVAKEEWMKEEAFAMLPHQWSSIHVPPDGEIAFFYFQEKKPHPAPILEQLALGKETIAADAKRFLAERLLEKAKRKQSIIIPLPGETK